MFSSVLPIVLLTGFSLANHEGGPGGPMGGPMHDFPAWLQGAMAIMINPELTRIEQTNQVNAWAGQQNATIQVKIDRNIILSSVCRQNSHKKNCMVYISVE
jgi:hypothetical protein